MSDDNIIIPPVCYRCGQMITDDDKQVMNRMEDDGHTVHHRANVEVVVPGIVRHKRCPKLAKE